LIHALLEDDNPHRRHAAARALVWISRPRRAATLALARCLVDPTQPQPAREEAAESLAYVGTRETIEPLIAVLGDPDVRIRFWAVFALGGWGHQGARTVQALESMLEDREAPPGNWWSVGKEALAMLASMQPPVADYKARLIKDTERILSDPNASAEDHRWAVTYG
jgi:HEAT repeat protein